MLEIRELVIEARVVDDRAPRPAVGEVRRLTESEHAELVEQVVRRVLAALDEQRERL